MTLAKSARPSVLPSTASEQRSGWGINPRTLPAIFVIPAMLRAAPFGLLSRVIWRSGAQVVAVREAARQHDQLTALEGIVLVPEELGLLLQHVFPDVVDVVVAVAAGKDDDAALHGRAPTSPSSSTE